ncbi:ankyrin-1-like [Papaver somniferum]|uniref:ankyrin-1-like n=1 Tax=Papaver somniferum TaxID=3469 RepID=UPI000E6F6E9E|nr:ankyrin-1-like [Papaver somniferum]
MDQGIFRSELFKTAYTGNLSRFKRLALKHAEAQGIEVGKAIGKLVDVGGKGLGKIFDEGGRGCLHFAAEGGSLNVCKYLLDTLKVDVDAIDGKGYTPLCRAIEKGHLDTVRYLLEKGANADAPDDKNYTPLQIAVKSGDTKMIASLLSKGVHLDVANRVGTALEIAAGLGHQNAVKMLLDHGANPNVASPSLQRPLILAISAKSWESVEHLLQAGADPNAVSCGTTPLIAAARDGRTDVVMRLLEAGADPNYKMNAGLTALEMAAVLCNHQSVGVLFPVTSRIPTYPDWSIAGLLSHLYSDANKMQRKAHEMERFRQAKSKGRDAFQGEQYHMAAHWYEEALQISPKDPAVLSNLSACYARAGEGILALDYAMKCGSERPEWPKAHYRFGVACNVQKMYGEAADAFKKGLTLDPRNKELKDAYMKAIENKMNSLKVEEDNAE